MSNRKMTRWQFMRGTDPIKSNWVYPKLICKIASYEALLKIIFLF